MYSNQESTQSPRQICHSCDILVICLFLRFRALYNKEMKKELLKQLYLIKKTRNSARDVLTYKFGIVFFPDTFKNRTYPHIKKASTEGLRDWGGHI